MGAKVKGIVVELGGDATGLSKAIKSVTAEAKDTQSELKKIERLLKMDPTNVTLLKQKQELLNQSIEKTETAVKALKDAKAKADKDMENGTEVNEKAYRELERQIEANEMSLRDARKEADKVAKALNDIDEDEIRDVAEAAEDAEKSLEGAKKEAADFGDVLKAGMITEAAGRIADSLKDIAEESKEYRKIMGSLEVSSEQAGYTVLETSDAYRKLYGVLADEQSAATTLANLQALELSQEDLLFLIDDVIGGWVKYGDSIPIDGLAEAINETAKVGQVTGTFADILNWGAKEGETYGVKLKENISFTQLSAKELKKLSGAQLAEYEATKAQYDAIEEWNNSVLEAASAEDYFNLALQQCTTKSERLNLVMKAMSDDGLANMAEKWRENNKEIVEANLVQETFTARLAYLGERVEPVLTEIQEGASKLLGTILDLAEGVDLAPVVNIIEAFFGTMDQLIYFLVDNSEFVIGAIAAIGSGLMALKLSEFAGKLSSVFRGVQSLSQAFPILGNAIAILTNPIFLVTTAIVSFAALAAIKGDEIQAVMADVDSYMQNVFATDWAEVFGPVLGGVMNGFMDLLEGAWNGGMDFLNGVIDFVQSVFVGDWESAWNSAQQILKGALDLMLSFVGLSTDDIKTGFDDAISFVKNLLNFEWKWPRIPMPHFSWSGGFSLNPLSTPKLSVSWFAEGAVLKGAQLFGMLGGKLLGGGEAGEEAVLPLKSFYEKLRYVLEDILYGFPGMDILTAAGSVNSNAYHHAVNNNSTTNLGGVNIAVYGAPGQDVRELAEIVMDEMQHICDREEAAVFA